MTQTPAGWHPAPDRPGQMRYWDGSQWTDQYAPAVQSPLSVPPRSKLDRPWFKKKRWWVAAAVVVLIVAVAGSGGGGGDEPDSASDEPSSAAPEPVEDAPADEPEAEPEPEPEPELTASQENAIEAAESYLEFSGFSKRGLIRQLSSPAGDNYPKADAVFAVNQLEVDWKQEAVEAAESYLEFSSFSRDGLIQQLTSSAGDMFTRAEAVYAADQVGL